MNLRDSVFRRPVVAGLILLAIAFAFRLVDIFVLRLDERLGEIILSKALGFGLVVVFLWAIGEKLASIGFHRTKVGRSLVLGTVVALVPLAIGYSVEFVVMQLLGKQPQLALGAIDPKAGVTGGLAFAAFLLLGNVVNSFMEEGLFRGVLLNLGRLKLPFARASWLQALLFACWHLVWVVKWYQTGVVSNGPQIGMAVIANFLPQLCLALVWAYAYFKTDNLWSAWMAHTLTNSTLNFLHVATPGGLDGGMSIRMTTFSIISLFMMFAIRYMTARWSMPTMQVWRSAEGQPAEAPLEESPEAA